MSSAHADADAAAPADRAPAPGSARPSWRLLLALDLTVLVVAGSIVADLREELGLAFGVCFVLTAWTVAVVARRGEALVAATAVPAALLAAVLALALFTGHQLAPGYAGWRMVPAALGHELWALLVGTAGALGCAWLRRSGRIPADRVDRQRAD